MMTGVNGCSAGIEMGSKPIIRRSWNGQLIKYRAQTDETIAAVIRSNTQAGYKRNNKTERYRVNAACSICSSKLLVPARRDCSIADHRLHVRGTVRQRPLTDIRLFRG